MRISKQNEISRLKIRELNGSQIKVNQSVIVSEIREKNRKFRGNKLHHSRVVSLGDMTFPQEQTQARNLRSPGKILLLKNRLNPR